MEKISTWQDFDEERLRKLTTIAGIEWKLEKARERLDNWSTEITNYLRATIGERDKQ